MAIVNLESLGATYKAHGYDAEFFILNWRGETLGLKLFPKKYECDSVKKWQRMAAKCGIGPAVKSPTLTVTRDGKRIEYGYLTEIAKVNANKLYPEDEIDKLDQEFHEVFGFYHPDFHEGNIGYLSNGKLVYIDFGF